MELEECRREIDGLDRELAEDFGTAHAGRAAVAFLKKSIIYGDLRSAEERQVLDKIISAWSRKLSSLRRIYQCIMDEQKYEREHGDMMMEELIVRGIAERTHLD